MILLGSRLIIERIVKILKIGKSAAKHLLYIYKEFGYMIDERSETIERKCKEDNYDMEQILDIALSDIFE